MLSFGLLVSDDHTKPVGGGIFELRPEGKEGWGRVLYCTLKGRKIGMLHGFIKKKNKTPRSELKIAKCRMQEVEDGKVAPVG